MSMHARTSVRRGPAWHRVSRARTRTLLAAETSGFVANDFGIGNLGTVAKRFMHPRPAPSRSPVNTLTGHSLSTHIRGIACARGAAQPREKKHGEKARRDGGLWAGGEGGSGAAGRGRGRGRGTHSFIHSSRSPTQRVRHPGGGGLAELFVAIP